MDHQAGRPRGRSGLSKAKISKSSGIRVGPGHGRETELNLVGLPPSAKWTPERYASLSRSIALVIAGGVLLGLFAAAVNLYYIAAAIGAAILMIVVSYNFEAAVVIYALVAFLPWGRTPDLATGGSGEGKGLFISEMLLGLIAVIWLGKYIFRSLPKNRIRSGFHVPLALYLIYCILNLVNSFMFWDVHIDRVYQYPQVNFAELLLRLLSGLAFVICATTISSKKWLRLTTWFLMIPAVYNTLNALTGLHIPLQSPWFSLLTFLPVSYAMALVLDQSKSIGIRLACGFYLLLTGFVVFYMSIGWISGWSGMLVCLATVTWIKNRKLFVIAVLTAAVVFSVFYPFFHQRVYVKASTGGDFDRISLLEGGLLYATHFPLGVGIGNYRSYNLYYGEKWGTTAYTSAHGTYSQLLAEMGIPGFILFVSMLICGYRWMLVNYKRLREGPAKIFLLAAMGQLAGIAASAAIGDYIIPTYHNGGLGTFSTTVYSWLIWGLAVAYVRIEGQEKLGSVDIHN